MQNPVHPWRTVARHHGRRAALGLTIALSLTLVAFEWQGGEMPLRHEAWDPIEDDRSIPAILPPVHVERTMPPRPRSAKRPNRPALTAARPDGHTTMDDNVAMDPSASDVTGEPSPDVPTNGPDVSGDVTASAPWKDIISIRPYLPDCLEHGPGDVDACTEIRIGQHLERRFKVPPGTRGVIRTTITFEIDTMGRVGRVVCIPQVSPAVEAEAKRVIRSLPTFEPGRQGPHRVPVHYQIPLSVQVR